MSSTEAVFFWLTALASAVAFFMTSLSVTFKKVTAMKAARYAVFAAFLSVTLFGAFRWAGSGHPPFVTLFESMIMSVWFIFLIYIILQAVTNRFSVLLLPISLATLLMMGWSATLPQGPSPLSSALDHVWLFIHASFATSGAAAFVIASSFSAIYLLGEKRLDALAKITQSIPEYRSLPRSIVNFVIFGLILWGVMIVSGSIWAHIAWGRYWAWDPIELWSLISWLLYGLILHSRMGWKISIRAFCWLTIIAALTVVFSLWGVGYVYETIHSYG